MRKRNIPHLDVHSYEHLTVGMNGTYPLMFIGRVSNSRRNGTYPLMFR